LKIFFVLIPVFALIFFGCKNNTVYPPLTTESVVMGNVTEDQVSSPVSGSATHTALLNSGALNFLDRDSTIVSFYYRGTPGNTQPYQLQIYDSTSNGLTSIYTFRDDAATDSLKLVTAIMPSHKAFAHYFYSISCGGATPQSFYIKNLTVYKK
jgi:hypothetical protein